MMCPQEPGYAVMEYMGHGISRLTENHRTTGSTMQHCRDYGLYWGQEPVCLFRCLPIRSARGGYKNFCRVRCRRCHEMFQYKWESGVWQSEIQFRMEVCGNRPACHNVKTPAVYINIFLSFYGPEGR